MQFRSYGQTELEPLTLAVMLVAAIWLFVARRQNAILPLLVVSAIVAARQRFVILDLDFTMIRSLILLGWLRVLIRGDARPLRLSRVDVALLLWILVGTFFQTLRDPTVRMLIFRAGVATDCFGIYFLVRVLVRDTAAVRAVVRQLVWISIIISAGMLYEALTHSNPFALLGVEPFKSYVRDGRLRCHGAFSHAIMAGSFGASIFPLAMILWLTARHRRWLAGGGMLASLIIVVTSASTGPIVTMAAGVMGWAFWPARAYLREVRLVFVATLLAIHLSWKKPVWYLIGHVSSLFGGTGWHRVRLINAAVDHFDQWWFKGANYEQISGWGWGLQDITNAYIVQGTRAGIWNLGAFLWLLWAAFLAVGRRIRAAREVLRGSPPPRLRLMARRDEIVAWGLGVALATHCVAFTGVLYFGQMLILFYIHLALIACLEPFGRPRRRSAPGRDSSAKLKPKGSRRQRSNEPVARIAGRSPLLRGS